MTTTVEVIVIAGTKTARQHVRQQLADSSQIRVAGCYDSVSSFRLDLNPTQADVVAADISLPLNDLLSLLHPSDPGLAPVKLLLLADEEAPSEKVYRLVEAGALGCIFVDSDAATMQDAVLSVEAGKPYIPSDMSHPLLSGAVSELEITARERRDRLYQLALTVIPISAALTGLLGILEGEYWERLGVRPEDLGFNPADRLSMLVVAVLTIAGLLGPFLFVGSLQRMFYTWLSTKVVEHSTSDARAQISARVYGVALALSQGMRGRILIGALILGLVTAAAIYALPVLVVLVGPAVIVVLLINVMGLEEYFPKSLDLPRYPPKRVLVVSGAIVLSITVILGYELLIVGPDMRPDGVHNHMSQLILDIEVFPVEVSDRANGSIRFDALLLGGSRGIHVLYDPCGEQAVWVPVNSVDLTAIEVVSCQVDTTSVGTD